VIYIPHSVAGTLHEQPTRTFSKNNPIWLTLERNFFPSINMPQDVSVNESLELLLSVTGHFKDIY
jgi:hypothetical protein